MKTLSLIFEFGPVAAGEYLVMAKSDRGDAHGVFRNPFSATEVEEIAKALKSARVHPHSDFGFKPMETGSRLFHALIHGNIKSLYERIRERRGSRSIEFRLKFNPEFAGYQDLYKFPWEYLYDPKASIYVAKTPNMAIVRELVVPQDKEKRIASRAPWRALFVTTGSEKDEAGKANRHFQKLRKDNRKAPTLRFADSCFEVTRQKLVAALQKNRGPDVIYFLLHGTLNRKHGGQLKFFSADGQGDFISSNELADLIVNYHPEPERLQLVYLNVCRSGVSASVKVEEADSPQSIPAQQSQASLESSLDLKKTIQEDSFPNDMRKKGAQPLGSDLHFLGVAEALVLKGVANVIAMGHEVDVDHVTPMARTFFKQINQGKSIAASLSVSRDQIRNEQTTDIEWGKPLHFAKKDHGYFLNIDWVMIQKMWSYLGLLIFYLIIVFKSQIQGANLGLPGTTLEGPPAALLGMGIVGPLYFLFLNLTRIYVRNRAGKEKWYERLPQFMSMEFNYFYKFGRWFQGCIVLFLFILPFIAQVDFFKRFLSGKVYYDKGKNFSLWKEWPTEEQEYLLQSLGFEKELKEWSDKVDARFEKKTENKIDHFVLKKVLEKDHTVWGALNSKMDYVYEKRKYDYFPIVQPILYLMFLILNGVLLLWISCDVFRWELLNIIIAWHVKQEKAML